MRYQKPKGTRDLFGKELERIEAVLMSARAFFKANGYEEIRTPTFEFVELFSRAIGESTDIVEKEMYVFEIDERLYALRPEGTAAVLRAFIENRLTLPGRFLYVGSMYRKEKPQKGRYREFLQIGIELLGQGAPFYDAEIIFLGKKYLESIGVKDFFIEVNSIGCAQCRNSYKEKLKDYLKSQMDRLCRDCRRRFERNFLRIFDCKEEACQKVYLDAPKITLNLCADCYTHYARVKGFLKDFGIEFQENKHLVRGLDYYTRTVIEFKHHALGAQNTIIAGGRYDLLMKELGGSDLPCLGWAMGVERTLLSLPENLPAIKEKKRFFIATIGESLVNQTIRLQDFLQKQDFICILGNPLDPIKHQLKDANRYNAEYVIIYGEDEAKEGVYTVKNMKTGEQKKIKVEEFEKMDWARILNSNVPNSLEWLCPYCRGNLNGYN